MSLLYLWRRDLELLTNLFPVRHKYICDALVRTMGGRRISQLRKFAKIYDIVPFWFGANPREFYSWNSKIWFRKTDISPFSKAHIGWEIFREEWNVEIPCWVITCDPLFERILVSYKYLNKLMSLRWKGFRCAKPFPWIHHCANTNAICLVIAPFRLPLTWMIFFFYIMSRLNCHSEPITVYGKNSETVARWGVRTLSRLGFHG